MKTGALYVILIILGVMAFIGSIKATVTIAYADEIKLYVKVLFLKINILPSKEKKYKKKMSRKKAEKIKASLKKKAEKKKLSAEEKEKKKEEKKESGEKKSPAEIISMVRMFASIGVAVIETFFRHLRIRVARIKITVASDDAATTAVTYGAISQSLNVLLPLLESVKNFHKLKKAEIAIGCDFSASEPDIDIKLSFSIRVWHIFHVAFAALKKLINHMLSAPKKENNQDHIHEKLADGDNNKNK